MKKISIVSSCFNEEDNIPILYRGINEVIEKYIERYEFEFIFIDNDSTDFSQDELRKLAMDDKRVKLIFNSRNFGYIKSAYYAIMQASGDAVIYLASDLQDPPELIADFIDNWEKGCDVVIARKYDKKSFSFLNILRKFYYFALDLMKDEGGNLIRNYKGFGLYDKKVIDKLKEVEDPYPYFRGSVLDMGFSMKIIDFDEPERTSGFDLIEEIRLQGRDIPVIFMSARDKEFDRIIGLEKGSDDYITKPFSPKELVLRVNNVIKRVYKSENNRIMIDGYELDEEQRKVFFGNEEIDLTTKEFDLLMMFIKNKGIAFSRDKILENVWEENYYGSDRVVDDTLRRLRDLGNSVLVVEHDEDTMRAADYLIDIGPGAGAHGGQVVACGTPQEVMANPNSLTGQYLSGKKKIEVPKERRKGNGNFLTVRGAQENNLKNLDVSIPLGTFTCVTGVSGSGKSSLVNEIIYKKLGADLNRMKVHPGRCKAIEGEEFLDKVICIDQSPIGRTPRSNPATYTNLFNDIRDLFASTPDAKARGYAAGRFSFNVRGGRCEACSGDGQLKIEMHFLPDIYVPCEVCKGKRYNRETLEVHYKGKSIADVLEMTVEEALEFFRDLPKLEAKLRTLSEVGLGYIRLGQSSTTLSGGEAQRVKLATELSKRSTGRTIYILDEPTTGLHTDDVKKLLEVLQRLVDAGNTVLVIEHNLDVIKCADYLLDLGPEGGSGGGTLVTCGTPEEVAACEQSYTGQYLRKMLR